MTDLEQTVRDVLSADADGARTDVDLLVGVRGRRAARRNSRLQLGGAALAVAVIVAAVAVPLSLRRGGTSSISGPSAGGGQSRAAVAQPVSGTLPPPPGTRAVTWAGIQLDVPASWTSRGSDPHRCARDDHAGGQVDYRDHFAFRLYDCRPAEHPQLERLELGTAYSFDENAGAGALVSPSAPPPETGSLAGLPASYTRVNIRGQLITLIQLPTLGTELTLTSNSHRSTEAILATAHRVSTDENGCAVEQPADLRPVAGGGSGGTQVVGNLVSAVICGYAGSRLVSGTSLDAAETTALTAALNRLPARYAPAQKEIQAKENAQVAAAPELDVNVTPFAAVFLRGADGSVQQVSVQALVLGPPPGVAGAGQATLTREVDAELMGALHTGFGRPGFMPGGLPSGCDACTIRSAPEPVPATGAAR